MKKWIFIILAVLLICGGVFGYIWWLRNEREKEAIRKAARERAQRMEKEANEIIESVDKAFGH